MSNSYKSYSRTQMEKMKVKERHEFRRDWREKKENETRKLWLVEMQQRDEGIGGA